MTALPSSPAALRNREPIRAVLAEWLPAHGRVLELAAGLGEQAVYLAAAFPGLDWLPTDADADVLTVIAARRDAEATPNLQAPLRVDVTDEASWPDGPFDGITCVNMIHISPWEAAEGLMRLAQARLKPGGLLYLYGPYLEADRPLVPSNAAFDESLKARDPRWGLRELAEVEALALTHGLILAARADMPANNLSVMFRRA